VPAHTVNCGRKVVGPVPKCKSGPSGPWREAYELGDVLLAKADERRNVDVGQDLAGILRQASVTCKSENDAKLLARELMKKGHQVQAKTVEGQNPVRIIADQQIFAWLAEN
jgi:hypothetical protein